MMLCYSCFSKLNPNTEFWDDLPCDPSSKKACKKCGLVGLYIRDVVKLPEELKGRKLDPVIDPHSGAYGDV